MTAEADEVGTAVRREDVRLETAAQPGREARSSGRTTSPSASDARTSGRHDRDRIYYSRSFLRLSGVTQVLTPSDEGSQTHNRLTHTLKVAQVARSIAELLLTKDALHRDISALGGLDADVVEAAALAHDLGHAPFGHIGEVVLDKYAREVLQLSDGYEGNAQSFRILTAVEPRSAKADGMDVSSATLAAVAKYPWSRSEAKPTKPGGLPKFNYYAEDAAAFSAARAWLPNGYDRHAQTLEAAIMDVADDITYALHDLEDFRSAGILPLNEVISELEQWTRQHADKVRAAAGTVDDAENKFGRLRARLQEDPAYEAEHYVTAVEAAANHLRGLTSSGGVYWRVAQSNSRRFISSLISDCVRDVRLDAQPSRTLSPLQLAPEHWHLIQILKQVTRDFVIGRSDVAAVQRGQQRRLRELLELLSEWLDDSDDVQRASPELAYLWDTHGPRGLLDYVAGLTDRRAVALHGALLGQGAQTVVTALAL